MQILIKEILRQTGTIIEYSDMFKSLFGIVSLLDGTHYVDLFIEGLRSKTGSVARRYNPKSLWSAYFLAKWEESRETVDNDNDSVVLDDDFKETKLRVSGMDGDNELVDNVTG
nr:hypothetical protein [Tanacetum cinerariifolium]